MASVGLSATCKRLIHSLFLDLENTKTHPGKHVSSAKIEKLCPDVNSLYYHGSCVKTKKPTWLHYD